MAPIKIQKLRLYLDTTIPNYVFATHLPHKMKITKALFRGWAERKYDLFISDVVLRELEAASEPKRRRLLAQIVGITQLAITEEAERLANEYVKRRVISQNYFDDARHVAIATCNKLDAVVSWNYGHLVNINKIKAINKVNEANDYQHIEIVSPEEVVSDEESKY